MKKLIGILIALFAFFIKNPLNADKAEKKKAEKETGSYKEAQIKEKMTILSKKEIAKKLKELKAKPIPQNLSQGAMCYKVSVPLDRIDYICPICGSKTIYQSSPEFILAKDIAYIRSLISPLMKYGITLDERALCKKCGQQINEKTLCIQIPYQEDKDKPHRRCSIQQNDLSLMYEFLNGKDRHESSYGSETPLVDFISQLEELFGVKVE